VFARLINMDIEPFLLASSVIGVVGLRLIRKNCPLCSEPYQPEAGYLRLLPPELVETASFRRGVGCKECLHTGFTGRTALTEMLLVDEVFRDAVLQKMPTRALQQVATQQGMRNLWQMGLRRVADGQAMLEEILRVIAVDQF
jgi:type II secretory ATPase GspE/PulE/Tfp pilus assembly ATPase PilB-like protein